MVRKYIYLMVAFLSCFTTVYGQLDQFMIMAYHRHCPPNVSPDNFFYNMKNNYKINTTLLFFPFDTSYNVLKAQSTFAQRNGMKVLLAPYQLHSRKPDFSREGILAELKMLSDITQQNIMGYHIADEPFVKTPTFPNGYEWSNNRVNYDFDFIDNIPQYINLVKEYNPLFLRYANLNPISFIVKNRDIKTGDKEYRENYIQEYIDISKPNLLSFDHYPIWLNLPYLYYSLYDMALKSVENSIPFIYVLSSINKGEPNYNAKKLNEFYYMIYSALCYGAKGIAYYPGFEWIIIDIDNDRFITFENGVKENLSALHSKLTNHSDELLSLSFVSAYHYSDFNPIKPNEPEIVHPFSKWSNFRADKYAAEVFSDLYIPLSINGTGTIPKELVITFMRNPAGKIFFWVFNRSLERSFALRANIKSTFRDVLNNVSYNQTQLFSLAPGEAKLFDSNKYYTSFTTIIKNKTYPEDFYPLETVNGFTIGSDDPQVNVTFEPGATKTFCANTISIKSTEIKKGSTVRFMSTTQMNANNSFSSRVNFLENELLSSNDFQKYNNENRVYIYPNPLVDGLINLFANLGTNEVLDICIYNATGQIIKKQKMSNSVKTVSISDFPSGIYIVSFIKDGHIYTLKVVK